MKSVDLLDSVVGIWGKEEKQSVVKEGGEDGGKIVDGVEVGILGEYMGECIGKEEIVNESKSNRAGTASRFRER